MRRTLTGGCVAVVLGGLMLGRAAADVPEAVRVRQVLMQTVRYPGADDPKATLKDVLDQIAKMPDLKPLKLKFDINEIAFKYEMVPDVEKTEVANPNPIPPMNTSLDTVLKKILSRIAVPSRATYVIQRDGTIEITTGQWVWAEYYDLRRPEGLPPGAPEEPAVVMVPMLPPLVVAAFEEESLAQALRTLARQTRANVVLDLRAAKDAAKTPVTAELINVPLDDAVRLLADMTGLRSVYVGRVLYVTTPENAARLAVEEKKRYPKPKRDAAKQGPGPVEPVAPKKAKTK